MALSRVRVRPGSLYGVTCCAEHSTSCTAPSVAWQLVFTLQIPFQTVAGDFVLVVHESLVPEDVATLPWKSWVVGHCCKSCSSPSSVFCWFLRLRPPSLYISVSLQVLFFLEKILFFCRLLRLPSHVRNAIFFGDFCVRSHVGNFRQLVQAFFQRFLRLL